MRLSCSTGRRSVGVTRVLNRPARQSPKEGMASPHVSPYARCRARRGPRPPWFASGRLCVALADAIAGPPTVSVSGLWTVLRRFASMWASCGRRSLSPLLGKFGDATRLAPAREIRPLRSTSARADAPPAGSVVDRVGACRPPGARRRRGPVCQPLPAPGSTRSRIGLDEIPPPPPARTDLRSGCSLGLGEVTHPRPP